MASRRFDRSRRRFLQAIALAGSAGSVVASGQAKSLQTERPVEKTRQLAERLSRLRLSHPRLHFNRDDLMRIRARAEGTHARYVRLLFEWCEQNRGWHPPIGLRLNEVLLEESGAFVTNAALAFVLSGSQTHLELARSWALAMCEMPRGELRNYGLGIYAAGLARAYDWLHGQWSESERKLIRGHLSNLIHQLYVGSIPESRGAHWWADAHMHHDHWVPVGGFGEAALALLGEVEDATLWAAHAKTDFDVCLSWLGEDGAWHEGVADWCYALAPLLWFYGAWESVVGDNLHDIPWLRNTVAFRLYHWLPDDSYVYLNDSFRSGRYNTSGNASCHLLRRLASLFRDGYAQWLADRDEAFDLKPGPKGVYRAPYESSSYQAERTEYPHTASQCVAWNVLWYDPTVERKSPSDLPRSRHFANQDVAILRTGWDADCGVVSFSCGPLGGRRAAARIRAGETRSMANFSHAHADYNSLTLFVRGQYFIIPAGYARRSSRFQNTVSVNGADFRVEPDLDVRIRSVVEQPDFCYGVGDGTDAFITDLGVRRYRRHLVLLSGCLVVLDDLRLADTRTRSWNRFEWTLHSDPRVHRLFVNGAMAEWCPRSAREPRLTLTVLEPEAFAWEKARLESMKGTSMLESLRLVRPEWYSTRMLVLAVLSWEDDLREPAAVRGDRSIGVSWKGDFRRPAVLFALSSVREDRISRGVPTTLRNRECLLFAYDEEHPESYLRLAPGNF